MFLPSPPPCISQIITCKENEKSLIDLLKGSCPKTFFDTWWMFVNPVCGGLKPTVFSSGHFTRPSNKKRNFAFPVLEAWDTLGIVFFFPDCTAKQKWNPVCVWNLQNQDAQQRQGEKSSCVCSLSIIFFLFGNYRIPLMLLKVNFLQTRNGFTFLNPEGSWKENPFFFASFKVILKAYWMTLSVMSS